MKNRDNIRLSKDRRLPKDRFTLITIDDTSMIPPELSPADINAMEKRLGIANKKP